jgi:hypothetical protein
MVYETIGGAYIYRYENCLKKLIQWDEVVGHIYKTYHGTKYSIVEKVAN